MVYYIITFIFTSVALLLFRAYLSRQQTLVPHNLLQARTRIRQLFAAGSYLKAKKLLDSLGDLIEKDIELAIFKIETYKKLGHLSSALSLCQHMVILYPNTPALHKEQGYALLEMGRGEEALVSFHKINPKYLNKQDTLAIAEAYLLIEDAEEAWHILTPFLEEDSSSTYLYKLAGDCQFQKKKYEQALAHYQVAAQQHGAPLQVHIQIAYCLQKQGNWQEAEDAFAALIKKHPTNIDIILGLGSCYEHSELYEKALDLYQEKPVWDLESPHIVRQAGICAAHLKQYRFGELYLRFAIEENASTPQAYFFLGHCLEAQQKWKEAETTYLSLIKEFPTYMSGYLALGWMFAVGHTTSLDNEKGLAIAYQALSLHDHPIAWEICSACEARVGNYQKAHQIYELLSCQTGDKTTRMRHKRAMRSLRKKRPLEADEVSRALVA